MLTIHDIWTYILLGPKSEISSGTLNVTEMLCLISLDRTDIDGLNRPRMVFRPMDNAM